MKKITCVYYQKESGRIPVKEFINSLDLGTQRKFFYVVELLEEFGSDLPYPHAKYVGDDIFELRFVGREGAVRILYFFFHEYQAVLTNGFLKKSNRMPKQERAVAVERRREFLIGRT